MKKLSMILVLSLLIGGCGSTIKSLADTAKEGAAEWWAENKSEVYDGATEVAESVAIAVSTKALDEADAKIDAALDKWEADHGPVPKDSDGNTDWVAVLSQYGITAFLLLLGLSKGKAGIDAIRARIPAPRKK